MNMDDRAVVVGIRLYPGISDLGGPENDALAFRRWLVDPSGGAVPPENVELFVSSRYYPDAACPPRSTTDALPTRGDITKALDRLLDLSKERSDNGKGSRIGRRLYLYFAGHGFCPGHEKATLVGAHTALLAANASTSGRTSEHVASTSFALWFRMAGYFDEVLLFMDCCRQDSMRARLNPIYDAIIHPNATSVRHFNAFATQWNGLAREKPMADGVIHGVFTAALLAGLNGAASMANGEITAESLELYLRENMRSFLSEEERSDPKIPKEPDVDFSRGLAARFVIARVPPPVAPTPLFIVKIHVQPGDLGKTVGIRNGALDLVETARVASSPWCLELPRGLYACELADEEREVNFSVKGAGPFDVNL